MLFYEKLYKLRKESGLSQEALAEKLNTSRQAVSKWENNQGYTETEKLLLMSNLFGVSVDYLLKDANESSESHDKGYYASKEMIEGYFTNRESAFGTLAVGLFFLVLGAGAYYKFTYEDISPVVMVSLLLLGGVVMAKGATKLDDKFDVLEKETLIFDKNFQSDVEKRYRQKITKLSSFFGVSAVVFLLGIAPMVRDIEPFTKDFSEGIPLSFEIMFIAVALSAPILFYTGSLSEVYSSIVNHEKHINSFGFRVAKKLRSKCDSLLK